MHRKIASYITARTVGVIVPMYNSADTIYETLKSVIEQTYDDLDIVVVDDGSTDDSVVKVQTLQAQDARIRIISQQNAGVATARNMGVRETEAPYLAFLDADDLWAPNKIEAQMRLLPDGGDPALVWCWYVHINGSGVAAAPTKQHNGQGNALEALCAFNIVGNGSSMLMHKDVFNRTGGFEPGLRAQQAQGAEDYLFALRAAEHFPFKVVERYLVGYRVTEGNMSANTVRMWKSLNLVCDEFRKKHPQYAVALQENLDSMLSYSLYRSSEIGDVTSTLFFWRIAARANLAQAIKLGRGAFKTLLIKTLAPQWMHRKPPPAKTLGPLYSEQHW